MGGMGNETRHVFFGVQRGNLPEFSVTLAFRWPNEIELWRPSTTDFGLVLGWKGCAIGMSIYGTFGSSPRPSQSAHGTRSRHGTRSSEGGARRECVLTLARFASPELNRCVRAAIGNASGLTQGQWRRCLDQVVAMSDHVADLLVADWVVFRL